MPLASRLPAAGTFTANITFFPKVNTLIIGHEVLERLDPSQRSIVREAAAQTLEYVLETNVPAAEEVAQACTAGIAVTIASEEEVSILEEAAQPVYARLEQDAQTRDLIDRIQDIKNQLHAPAAPPQTCSLEQEGPDTEPTGDVLHWRFLRHVEPARREAALHERRRNRRRRPRHLEPASLDQDRVTTGSAGCCV